MSHALTKECKIKELDLSQCRISYRGAHSFFSVVQRYQVLVTLTLDRNSLDGAKLKILRDMLSNNRGLRTLNLNKCQLGEDGALYIASGIIANKTLQTLNMADNNFGDEGLEHLTSSMIDFGETHIFL